MITQQTSRNFASSSSYYPFGNIFYSVCVRVSCVCLFVCVCVCVCVGVCVCVCVHARRSVVS